MNAHESLIAEARQAAAEQVGYDTGDGVLYNELADALEATLALVANVRAKAHGWELHSIVRIIDAANV